MSNKYEIPPSKVIEAVNRMGKTGLIYPSFIKYCPTMSKKFNGELYHVCETVQAVKSFKIRGALNAILCLTPEQKKKGVICASAGNHAQGTALSATRLGIKSYICMPSNAPLAKIQATKGFGGNVILAPEPSFDAAYALSKKLAKERGLTEIPPYDHPDVIAGQGTIAYEILSKLTDVDIIIAPIGGGGLIAGIASFAKAIKPDVEIVGVQAKRFPAMKMSFDKKKLVSYSEGVPTLADGCAVKTPGTITYNIIKNKVDRIVTVTEDEIAIGMNWLLEKGKIVSEGAGAMPTAAVLAGKVKVKGKKVAMLVSGGNVDIDKLLNVITHALEVEGRRFKTIIYLKDKKEVAQYIKMLSEHNCVGWDLVSEERITVNTKPGTYSTCVMCPDKPTADKIKAMIRKARYFVKCIELE